MFVGRSRRTQDVGGDRPGLARDRFNEAAHLSTHADAVTQGMDMRIAGAQACRLHGNAAFPGQAGALCEALKLAKSTLSRNVDRMQRNGWVDKIPGPDARSHTLKLSEAGRRLFAVSRSARSTTNDADRLRKYLQRFGLTWAELGA